MSEIDESGPDTTSAAVVWPRLPAGQTHPTNPPNDAERRWIPPAPAARKKTWPRIPAAQIDQALPPARNFRSTVSRNDISRNSLPILSTRAAGLISAASLINISFDRVIGALGASMPAARRGTCKPLRGRRHSFRHHGDRPDRRRARSFASLRQSLWHLPQRRRSSWKAGTRSSPARCRGLRRCWPRAAERMPLTPSPTPIRPAVAHFSPAYADLLSHFRTVSPVLQHRLPETRRRGL